MELYEYSVLCSFNVFEVLSIDIYFCNNYIDVFKLQLLSDSFDAK